MKMTRTNVCAQKPPRTNAEWEAVFAALQQRGWFISFIFQNPSLLHNFLACEVALMASPLQINSFIEVFWCSFGCVGSKASCIWFFWSFMKELWAKPYLAQVFLVVFYEGLMVQGPSVKRKIWGNVYSLKITMQQLELEIKAQVKQGLNLKTKYLCLVY